MLMTLTRLNDGEILDKLKEVSGLDFKEIAEGLSISDRTLSYWRKEKALENAQKKAICDFFNADLKIFSDDEYRAEFLNKYKNKKIKSTLSDSDQIIYLTRKVDKLELMNEQMLRILKEIQSKSKK